ncbi:MAG TPA: hypothetical protein VEQ59_18255 [Polyangiaceae bacterium]|nr:hypothetical protein [Polyangiaceae bacterium]
MSRMNKLWAMCGAVALVVGCSKGGSNGTAADVGGAADSPVAGASDGGGASGAPSPSTTDSGGAPSSSFAGAPGDGGAAASALGGAPGDTPTLRDLSCIGVLQCAGACPDEGVDACVEACVDRTRKSSEAVTAAFIQCIADSACADAACIEDKCESELAACGADDASAVQGTPSSGTAPTGSVPAELVGLWSQVGLSSGMSYEFSADGTTIQAFSTESNYGCELKTELSSSGVTTVDGDSLVYHRLEGTQGTKTCGTITTKALDPADIAYRYALGTDDDGDAQLSLYRVNEDGSLSSPLELHH